MEDNEDEELTSEIYFCTSMREVRRIGEEQGDGFSDIREGRRDGFSKIREDQRDGFVRIRNS